MSLRKALPSSLKDNRAAIVTIENSIRTSTAVAVISESQRSVPFTGCFIDVVNHEYEQKEDVRDLLMILRCKISEYLVKPYNWKPHGIIQLVKIRSETFNESKQQAKKRKKLHNWRNTFFLYFFGYLQLKLSFFN